MRLDKNRFALNPECFLVKGAKRGALYDLATGNIYSIDEHSIEILDKCERGLYINQIIQEASTVNGREIIDYFKNLESFGVGRFLDSSQNVEKIVLLRPEVKLNFIWLELTQNCNLRCIHCYSKSSLLKIVEKQNCLALSEWERVMDEAYKLGCRRLQYIGGEPFLYGPEIFTLIHHAKEQGFEFQEVFTNATLITKKDIERLYEYGARIAISLYSVRPEIHDKITNKKGSLKKTLESTRKIKDKGIPLRIAVVAMKTNQNYIEETLDFIKKEFDYQASYDIVRSSGRGCDFEIIPDKLVRNRKRMEAKFTKITKERFLKSLYGHICWRGKLSVNPNGNVTPCVMERSEVIGNLRKSSLKDMLEGEKIQKYWGLSKDRIEICKDCEFRYACFDCRPHAKNQSGHLYGRGDDCQYNPYTGQWDNSLIND